MFGHVSRRGGIIFFFRPNRRSELDQQEIPLTKQNRGVGSARGRETRSAPQTEPSVSFLLLASLEIHRTYRTDFTRVHFNKQRKEKAAKTAARAKQQIKKPQQTQQKHTRYFDEGGPDTRISFKVGIDGAKNTQSKTVGVMVQK